MKKISLLFITVLTFSMVTAHPGHGGLPEAGETPESILYGLDRTSEKINLLFTFSEKEKLEKRMEFAKERISESRELARDNRYEKVSELVNEFSGEMTSIKNKSNEKGYEELESEASEGIDRGIEYLEEIRERSPDKYREGIENALGELESVEIDTENELERYQEENQDETEAYEEEQSLETGNVGGEE